MVTKTDPEASAKVPESNQVAPRKLQPVRPLLAQKYSIASKEIRKRSDKKAARELRIVDYYVDSHGVDRHTVGPLSTSEPLGRLFNQEGRPVILPPGQQEQYLAARMRTQKNRNDDQQLLNEIEEQFGGPLRFEPWYNDLFSEDRTSRAHIVPGQIEITEVLKALYNGRPVDPSQSRCQDYYDHKHRRRPK